MVKIKNTTLEEISRMLMPKVVIPQGKPAEELYYELDNDIGVNYNDVQSIKVLNYNKETESLEGSNLFITSRLDEQLAPYGKRTLILSDVQDSKIPKLIKGKHYIDLNAVILKDSQVGREENNQIRQDLIKKIEQRERKLELPLMVVRPLVRYSAEEPTYNMLFELGENTEIISDERLDVKRYPTQRFIGFDETHMPLFDKKGELIWYASNANIVRLALGDALGVNSSGEYFANSGSHGRVAFVAEGAQKFSQPLSKQKSEHQTIKPYTPEQIQKYRQILQGVRTGELPNSKLEELLSFLKQLEK